MIIDNANNVSNELIEDVNMAMKEILDLYFNTYTEWYKKEYGSFPKTKYSEKNNTDESIYLPDTLDENGNVCWLPKLQSKAINFEKLENELGFAIHKRIKELFSIYWFGIIEGQYEIGEIWINGVQPGSDVLWRIKDGFEKGKNHYNENAVFFCLGLSDPYTIMLNNDTGEITAVLFYEEESIHLADSLEELLRYFIDNMR